MEEILSVMREIQELSTEHKNLNAVETTEKTLNVNADPLEKNVFINAEPIPRIDSSQFNQMLGRSIVQHWLYLEQSNNLIRYSYSAAFDMGAEI